MYFMDITFIKHSLFYSQKSPQKTVKYERWTVVIATNKIFGSIKKLQYMGGKIANKQNMTIYTALHT